ncbi:MAG: hypothetical protein IPG89_05140 [Bacteroidetes bacterium]|nr:hypothetical protein [Bacteroidota bacterium]
MSRDNYSILINKKTDTSKLQKGLWIVVINAARIPPHIGLLFNGSYSSLNIKGVEKDIDFAVLLRTIEMQGIKTVFVKLTNHPVFSIDFLREHFLHEVEKYEKVSAENTCFKPVRTFFQENYVLWNNELDFLYQLFPALYANNMIDYAMGLNIAELLEDDAFVLKAYSNKEIEDKLNEIKRLQLN